LELNFPNPIETRTDLFDREPELNVIQETLRSHVRRPVVIMGERVMGKTSLLNVVVEWAAQETRFSVLQLPHVSSRGGLVEEVLDGIAAEAHTSLHRLGLRDPHGRLLLSTVTEFARVAGELTARAGDRTFVVCLDELDSMLVNCPDDASANQIMDLILHVVGRTNLGIRFVFTITRTAPQILRSDASPFLSAARIVPLSPWSFEQTQAFVARLLGSASRLDEDAHRLLFALGGGHAYLIKAVLQALQDLHRPGGAGGTVTAHDVREAANAAIGSPEVDFTLENIATVHFSPEELEIMRRAAAGPAAVTTGGAAPEVVHELRQRTYLRVDQAGRYHQAYGLLGEWLTHRPWPGGRRPAGAPAPPGVDLAGDVSMLLIDDDRKRVFLGTYELPLTAQEYRFLNCLGAHAGSVVDRYTIATEVWPEEVLVEGVREGRLDALVYRLREELGEQASQYIETRRGRGYYVNPEHVRRVPGAAP
jgi:hypothetical protein